MSQKITTGLDSPIFAGRLRTIAEPSASAQKPLQKLAQPTNHKTMFTYNVGLDICAPPKKQGFKTVVATNPEPNPILEPKKASIPTQAVEKSQQTGSFDNSNFVKNAASWRAQKSRRIARKITSLVLIGMAGALFIFGSYVAFQAFRINQQFQPTASALAAGADDRDENEPSKTDMANYNVAPNMPRFIRIHKLNAEARVLHMGVNESNQMQTPSNIFDAGWYNQSSVPGADAGAAVISGHVSGPTKGGVFENLKQLVKGDEIEIERGDGKKITYKVVGSESSPAQKVNMQKAMTSQKSDKAGLTLITCTGSLDNTGRHYQDRLLVYAVER